MTTVEICGLEVPTEVVNHILAFNEPVEWARRTRDVCRAWRKESDALLHAYAATVWAHLPTPPRFCGEWIKGEQATEFELPEDVVPLYLWRQKPPELVYHVEDNDVEGNEDDDDDDDEDDWFSSCEYYQTMAICRAAVIPEECRKLPPQPDESERGYYHTSWKETALPATELLKKRPWAGILSRFIERSSCAKTFNAESGPVAGVIRLLLLASRPQRVVVLKTKRMGGYHSITTDYMDLKIFFAVRSSADAWLPWTTTIGSNDEINIICIHLRDAMGG